MKKNFLTQFSKLAVSILILSSLSCFAQKTVTTTSLFNGDSLEGWKTVQQSNQSIWSVIDGVITGGDGTKKITSNTYLHTVKEYEDFEFRCLFKLTGDHGAGFEDGLDWQGQLLQAYWLLLLASLYSL